MIWFVYLVGIALAGCAEFIRRALTLVGLVNNSASARS
jgi:hypothetical protein